MYITIIKAPPEGGGFLKFVHVPGFLGIQHIFSTTIQIVLCRQIHYAGAREVVLSKSYSL